MKSGAKGVTGSFERDYQRWYTEASAVARQLLTDRISEFCELYRSDLRRKSINIESYCIQDWLKGFRSTVNPLTGNKHYDDLAAASMRFDNQLSILQSAVARFDDGSLIEMKQIVQADLFDSELNAARELSKHGFLRAAGAVAGVVLEKHLNEVRVNHCIKTRKKHPSISDFNEMLKSESVIDVPLWRFIQHLGDIRNLCDHNKEREPSDAEIADLINGVERITKTLFQGDC